jgi:predicted lipid-binding transport protein (Tim44 family)
MAIGGLIGQNYNIPALQQTGGASPAENLFGGMPGGFTGPAEADFGDVSGLQYVEGMTDEVYQKMYNVRNFAKTMWKNYGIDVTSPRFDDDLSMQANQIYQKSVADLHFTIQDLKTSQKMLERDAASGQGYAIGFDPTAQPRSRMTYSPLRQKELMPEIKESLDTYQKGFGSEEEVEMANDTLKGQRDYLTQMRQQAEAAGDMAAVQDIDANIAAIDQAWYDPGLDKKLESAREIARLRAYATMNRPRAADTRQAMTDINAVYNSWATGQGTDPDLLLKNLFAPSGEPLFTRVWRSSGDKSTYAITQDGQTVKFPHGDKNFLFSYLAKFDPNWSKITGPLLDISEGNVPKIQPTGESVEQVEVDPGLIKETNKAKSALMSGKVRSDNQMGANHIQVLENMNSKALQGKLMIPPDVMEKFGGADAITEVRQGGWGNDVIKIKTSLGQTITLDIEKKEDRDAINRLIESNDVTLNPGYVPKKTTSSAAPAQKPSGTDIVPVQLEGEGVDNTKYDYYHDQKNNRYFYAEKGKRTADGKIKALGIVNVQ